MITFGERVRRNRERKNYTVPDFAKLIGVTEKILYNIETNRSEPNLETLIKMSNVLKVSLDYLIKGEYSAET